MTDLFSWAFVGCMDIVIFLLLMLSIPSHRLLTDFTTAQGVMYQYPGSEQQQLSRIIDRWQHLKPS